MLIENLQDTADEEAARLNGREAPDEDPSGGFWPVVWMDPRMRQLGGAFPQS